MIDSLGDRMKKYESVTRTYLMPRSYVCIRVDGRSFSNYTKNLKKPFDKELMEDMDATGIYLCENIQGAKVGFVQSDEISIVTANFDELTTQTFFDGNIQKISSVVASMATSKFNRLRIKRYLLHNFKNAQTPINSDILSIFVLEDVDGYNKLAEFDCRCWNVPDRWETYNTLLWRQQDASRNSISAVAQANFSHKELHGKSTKDMHEMLYQKGINWATDYTNGEKNGRLIVKETYTQAISVPDAENFKVNTQIVERTKWVSQGAWKFTEEKEKLLTMIPQYPV
jgi:tRNA(His) guanylyltransferase